MFKMTVSVDSDFAENEAAPSSAVETEDPDPDENYSGISAALNKAKKEFDFVEVPMKRCHCRCMLGTGDTPCINGFSDEE